MRTHQHAPLGTHSFSCHSQGDGKPALALQDSMDKYKDKAQLLTTALYVFKDEGKTTILNDCS